MGFSLKTLADTLTLGERVGGTEFHQDRPLVRAPNKMPVGAVGRRRLERRYLGTSVTHPSTIETLAVMVPVAVVQAAPCRMMSVGFVGSLYVHPLFGS